MATGYEDLLPTEATGVSGYEDLLVAKPVSKQQPTNSLGQLLRSAASLADVTCCRTDGRLSFGTFGTLS
jgi:hypothetical protein